MTAVVVEGKQVWYDWYLGGEGVYKDGVAEERQQLTRLDWNYSTIMCDSDVSSSLSFGFISPNLKNFLRIHGLQKCKTAPGADKRFEDKDLGDKAKDMACHAKEEVKEGWNKWVYLPLFI